MKYRDRLRFHLSLACSGLLLLIPLAAFAQLSGTMRDSITKLPVAGVEILARGAALRTAESSDTGTFAWDDVPAGKYVIQFSKRGYDPGTASIDVQPASGPVSLELRPWAEVEGTVFDEDGNPMEGIPVYVGGLRDTTGKDGRYHARDVTVGFQVPYDLRRRTLVRDEETGETFGYANTHFYPGVADRRLAAPLTIPPGSHLTHIDVRLRRTRLVEFQGKISGAGPASEIELDSAADRPDETYARRRLDAHGGFRFEMLAPGDYTVVVHRNRPGDDLPFLTRVSLGPTGIRDYDLLLPPFVTIEGVVRTARADLRSAGPLRIVMERQGYSREVRVSGEAAFALQAIPPGEWILTVDDSLLYRPDDPKRRIYASEARTRWRVTESGNPPLDITLSDATGWIRGIADSPGLVSVTSAGDPFATRKIVALEGASAFSVELPPGAYTIRILGGADCLKQAENVSVQAGGSSSVHLKSCGSGN